MTGRGFETDAALVLMVYAVVNISLGFIRLVRDRRFRRYSTEHLLSGVALSVIGAAMLLRKPIVDLLSIGLALLVVVVVLARREWHH